MSLQCVAHAVRALAVLPAPASPRRRTSHVSLSLPSRRPGLAVAPVRAAESSSPPAVPASAAGKAVVPDDEFSLAKVSFGVIGLGVGLSLLSYGFGSYFNLLPGSEWSALLLTYGFPLTIIGMALKYAELKPVPCITYADAFALREKCATPILKQVRSDVTRFRYGDEQHLDEALQRIFQYGLGGGIPRRSAPILQKIREEVSSLSVLFFLGKSITWSKKTSGNPQKEFFQEMKEGRPLSKMKLFLCFQICHAAMVKNSTKKDSEIEFWPAASSRKILL
ncbi:uncharacterized protein LOC8069886 isoform X2 [Sorghum bicolor]|uniref:uncharacterized protein LOC8069886 isoform X2 n=1 Tax=Sorghum bicolor TaxID=4558 RepID=UPI000B423F7F|nr:uncharacterized protein LOC8069886 isoform X2 [Sorghum bicolor]|eukprot:XP_021320987.1 uncharacterized protein LOC8069886 isoform X2 [Sorghum bicolor]